MHDHIDAYGDVTAPDTIRFERRLPAPVERVWAYLTEADKRRKWLAGGEMELRPGGKADLAFRHSEFADEPTPEGFKDVEAGFTLQGRIVEVDAPRLLTMTWGSEESESEVTFELFPENDQVLLVVTHRRLADRGKMVNVASGWHAHLEVLASVLEGGGAQRFWSRLLALRSAYTERLAVAAA